MFYVIRIVSMAILVLVPIVIYRVALIWMRNLKPEDWKS